MPPKGKQKDGPLTAVPTSILAAELPYRLSRIGPSYDPPPAQPRHHPSAIPGSNDAPYAPYSERIRSQNANLTGHGHSSELRQETESSSEPSSSNTNTSSSSNTRSTSTGYSSVSSPVTRKSVVALPPDATHFETLMARHESEMPAPGLSYFEQRRVLWYTPPEAPPRPPSPSPSRIKLEALLGQPGAVVSDEVWRAGLKNVWKGLVGGNMLRKRLPLDIVLKILQAGWLRDGTWPEGAVPPEWDEPPPPMPTPPPPPDPLAGTLDSLSLAEVEVRYKQDLIRHAHEQEAYDAAISARQHAESYAHAMGFGTGMGMGIPPGYSPSSGDLSPQYAQPYAYAEATPPPEEADLVDAHPTQVEEEDMELDADVPEDGETRQSHILPGDGRHEGG